MRVIALRSLSKRSYLGIFELSALLVTRAPGPAVGMQERAEPSRTARPSCVPWSADCRLWAASVSSGAPDSSITEAPDSRDDDPVLDWQSGQRGPRPVRHAEPAEGEGATEEEGDGAAVPAYTLPLMHDSRTEEEAACIHALFATCTAWLTSDDPPELRFRQAARVVRSPTSDCEGLF